VQDFSGYIFAREIEFCHLLSDYCQNRLSVIAFFRFSQSEVASYMKRTIWFSIFSGLERRFRILFSMIFQPLQIEKLNIAVNFWEKKLVLPYLMN
jgi:hypothetical protein